MLRHLRSSLLIFIALVAATGCSRAIFESSLDPFEAGLAYYLPKSLLQIEVQAVGFNRGTPVKSLSKAQKETADANGSVLVRARFGGIARDVLVDASGRLVREQLTSLKLLPVVPTNVADIEYSYTLQYQPRADYSDRICAGVTKNSLLLFVEAASKDETGNIIVSLGKFAGRIAGPSAFADTGGVSPLARSLKMQIDPFSRSDIQDFNAAIKARFPDLPGSFKLHVEGLQAIAKAHPREACPQDKVCYRTLVPVRIGLSQRGTRIVSLQYMKVINRAAVHSIDITRAFLVEKLTRLGFKEGVLQYAVIKKPSEALAAAQLPLTVYDAVLTSALAAPGRFLGEITPGLTSAEVLAILNNQKLAVDQTNDLRKQLAILRADGAAVPAETEDNLKLSCKEPT